MSHPQRTLSIVSSLLILTALTIGVSASGLQAPRKSSQRYDFVWNSMYFTDSNLRQLKNILGPDSHFGAIAKIEGDETKGSIQIFRSFLLSQDGLLLIQVNRSEMQIGYLLYGQVQIMVMPLAEAQVDCISRWLEKWNSTQIDYNGLIVDIAVKKISIEDTTQRIEALTNTFLLTVDQGREMGLGLLELVAAKPEEMFEIQTNNPELYQRLADFIARADGLAPGDSLPWVVIDPWELEIEPILPLYPNLAPWMNDPRIREIVASSDLLGKYDLLDQALRSVDSVILTTVGPQYFSDSDGMPLEFDATKLQRLSELDPYQYVILDTAWNSLDRLSASMETVAVLEEGTRDRELLQSVSGLRSFPLSPTLRKLLVDPVKVDDTCGDIVGLVQGARMDIARILGREWMFGQSGPMSGAPQIDELPPEVRVLALSDLMNHRAALKGALDCITGNAELDHQ